MAPHTQRPDHRLRRLARSSSRFCAIGLFYWWRGKIMLHEPPTGRDILRFTSWERIVHWTTAICFVILAVSGIFMLFGRYVILPLFGYTLFSIADDHRQEPAQLRRAAVRGLHAAHDRHLPPRQLLRALRLDLDAQVRRLSQGPARVRPGSYNAGEKVWFWLGVTLLGIVVSATGLVLDFPNFGQGREAMQIANVIHAVAAVGFMALVARPHLSRDHRPRRLLRRDAPRHGRRNVGEGASRIWYQDIMNSRGRPAPGASRTTAPASPMTDGWKA